MIIKCAIKNVQLTPAVWKGTNAMVGADMEGDNALNLALSQTSVQAINTATSKMGNFTLILHCLKSDNFTPIFFAILGKINIVKKNVLRILTVMAKRFAVMGNVSLVALVMIIASKVKLVEMASV